MYCFDNLEFKVFRLLEYFTLDEPPIQLNQHIPRTLLFNLLYKIICHVLMDGEILRS